MQIFCAIYFNLNKNKVLAVIFICAILAIAPYSGQFWPTFFPGAGSQLKISIFNAFTTSCASSGTGPSVTIVRTTSRGIMLISEGLPNFV